MVTATLNPPASVLANDKRLHLWNSANEDERFFAAALCDTRNAVDASKTVHYLSLGEQVKKRFNYKGNSFRYGSAIVPVASRIAGISAPLCYQILKTAKQYSLAEYQVLAAKAAANSVTLTWTQLKTLAYRLGKPRYDKLRKRIELKLTRKYYTDRQLNALIDDLAPETKPKGSTAMSYRRVMDTVCEKAMVDTVMEGTSLPVGFGSMVETFKECETYFKDWQKSINHLSHEIAAKDSMTIIPVLQQLKELQTSLEKMEQFTASSRHVLGLLETQAWKVRRGGQEEEVAAPKKAKK